MPAEFHWLRPEWLVAVPMIAAFSWLMARRRLRPGNWKRVIDPALQPYVLSGAPRAGIDWRWWLIFLGGTLAALSLAGPSWNRIEQPVYRSEQAMVMALDLSRSMDAEDVTPSRLARAKLKILDILGQRESGQTALVVYSSNAFTVTPLTTDTDTIAALVGSLSTDIMPSQGSNPVAAIDKSRLLLDQAGVNDGEILLITDGGASPAAERAAEELEEDGFSLSILGVGTLDGAPIPEAGGGFVTDRSGKIAVPKLEANGLKSLARAGAGRFAVLTTDSGDIDALLSAGFSKAGASGDEQATDQWQEEGPWLLLLLLPIAALAFRRGWIFAVLIFVVPLPAPAHAFEWRDLWQTDDQQARQELAEGDAGTAAALFEDPDWRGVAQYRAGNFAQSAAAFRVRDDADGLYNFGNALARQGNFESAVRAYERALEIDPGLEDARYNRDLVRQALEEQQAQSGEEGNQSGEDKNGQFSMAQSGDPSDRKGEEGKSGDPGNTAEQGGSPQGDEDMSEEDLAAMQRELERAANEAERREGEASEDDTSNPAARAVARREQERRQAMEQWLRRIPDDPGGLLRRKFRYQYQRQGVDQEGNSLWTDRAGDPW